MSSTQPVASCHHCGAPVYELQGPATACVCLKSAAQARELCIQPGRSGKLPAYYDGRTYENRCGVLAPRFAPVKPPNDPGVLFSASASTEAPRDPVEFLKEIPAEVIPTKCECGRGRPPRQVQAPARRLLNIV